MRFLLTSLACALALIACERRADDPALAQRAACEEADRAPAERIAACTGAIESGALSADERLRLQAIRGVAHRAAGEVTASLRDFEAVLRAQPTNADALEGRAAILLASGQLDAASPLIDRLIAQRERLDQAHLMRGDIAFQHGDYTGAIEAYDMAIQQNGALALAYAHRARAKQRLGDNAGALSDFEAAVQRDNDLVDARAGRCWFSLLQKQEFERARTDAETAVAAAPENVEAQLCRGVLQLRGGEWAGARTSFEAALAREPGNPVALFGRGVARRRGGDDAGSEDMNRARDFDRRIGETFEEFGVRTY
jgi:tetratricopeptide (TPR) repeat protein